MRRVSAAVRIVLFTVISAMFLCSSAWAQQKVIKLRYSEYVFRPLTG